MGESRIVEAMARIEAALKRIADARADIPEDGGDGDRHASASPKLMELVNRHERLREEVADSMRELDALIGELEA